MTTKRHHPAHATSAHSPGHPGDLPVRRGHLFFCGACGAARPSSNRRAGPAAAARPRLAVRVDEGRISGAAGAASNDAGSKPR
jgi:hypothetical protein